MDGDAEPARHVASRSEPARVEIGLNAAIVAVIDDEPVALVIRNETENGGSDGLPFGPFSPVVHRTLESGLRTWVEEQTGLGLGYVEQLYTFGDRGRHAEPGDAAPHVVSIGYLALTETGHARDLAHGSWRSWYQYFPWEDWRKGKPDILATEIEPRLRQWAQAPTSRSTPVRPVPREDRARICFGLDGGAWDEEKVLDRFELLYEAGLVEEARRDGREAAAVWGTLPRLGTPMKFDHRRILATAIGRVRAKIKYRPVIFELMPDVFTLFELQKTVEAILGPHLHKQNFRRLVESAGLVEPTGDVKTQTGGRPAKLFRFRREVVLERPAPGVRVKAVRV
ncbi:NAD regulator [Hyphomicrobium sp. CS1GBMeth3]|uniref:NUDIX hydrolase n=1 Tax=Hyphomicrobium sp. CS1GBMeth3 TaxID=1892845 RepID=UPI0009311A9E|nr:NAD regulator [Hyphomicrobium sp. CS1GBMeth3]